MPQALGMTPRRSALNALRVKNVRDPIISVPGKIDRRNVGKQQEIEKLERLRKPIERFNSQIKKPE